MPGFTGKKSNSFEGAAKFSSSQLYAQAKTSIIGLKMNKLKVFVVHTLICEPRPSGVMHMVKFRILSVFSCDIHESTLFQSAFLASKLKSLYQSKKWTLSALKSLM